MQVKVLDPGSPAAIRTWLPLVRTDVRRLDFDCSTLTLVRILCTHRGHEGVIGVTI
jgi:hypothetical protein